MIDFQNIGNELGDMLTIKSRWNRIKSFKRVNVIVLQILVNIIASAPSPPDIKCFLFQ